MRISPTLVLEGLIFTSDNVYDQSSWHEPVRFALSGIDPDLFWDAGNVYLTQTTFTEIIQSTIDLSTGHVGAAYNIWNGTGGRNPEGPHIYKKDGYYYLLIAEGGTELNHSVTMARSQNIAGPYVACPNNPLLTNRGTAEYFQTVGHADLFQDQNGSWWGTALATRSGPQWLNYPMGRETVLFPVTWENNDWPIMEPVRGRMSGWSLPQKTVLPGVGAYMSDPDVLDFAPRSSLPGHLVSWRYTPVGSIIVSPYRPPNQLQLTPSRANLTGDATFDPAEGITFIGRRQTHTLFNFTVDISFMPKALEEEAGITIFLTQDQHIDLGIVGLLNDKSNCVEPYLRFRTTVIGKEAQYIPATAVASLPRTAGGWRSSQIRLQVSAVNSTHYLFSAARAAAPRNVKEIGYAPATVVSGGTGPFTGTSSCCSIEKAIR